MRTYSYSLLPTSAGFDMAASSAFPASSTPAAGARFPSISTSCQLVEFCQGYSIQVAFTGIQPQGFFQLLAANIPSPGNTAIGFKPDYPAYWTPIAGTSTPIGVGLPSSSAATGSSGTILWNVDKPNYNAVQLQFIPTIASTGRLVYAQLVSKAWG